MAEVAVTRKGQERLADGHLWIYRADIELRDQEPEEGEIVRVKARKGPFLGLAFYSTKSLIALRMISWRDDKIDKNFWRKRLQAAANLRGQIVGDAQAYRLIHGDGDLIPSLIIDRYGDHFVIQTLSQATERLKDLWVELIKELFAPQSIIERNDVKVRNLEGLTEQRGMLYGELPEQLIVEQHGVKYYVDAIGGQKTGLFLDQRENHFAAQNYARGRALDCFTFVGGFALNMGKKAEQVLGLDVSAAAVTEAKRNAELNGASNVQFQEVNVFDQIKDFENARERFDTIVLDPPAFAKNRSSVPAAVRGYKEINLRAMKLLNPGGILISCSCSFNVGEEMFLDILKAAANDAGKRVQILEKRMQSRDHPVLMTVPESYYLKCIVMRVL